MRRCNHRVITMLTCVTIRTEGRSILILAHKKSHAHNLTETLY